MQLPLLTFETLLANSAAALQGASTQPLDLSDGSTLRALLEANASAGLWMQWLAVLVLRNTRAATSTAADLDSWMADFGFTRLPAVAATGSVTFTRLTPGAAAFIPPGVLLKSADGTQSFTVTTDAANTAWSATSNGYTIPAGQASLTVPVMAATAGAAGNVQAGIISQIATPLPGVDAVTNTLALTGGLDAETDAALRARFTLYIDSRSLATRLAVASAIENTRQGLRYIIAENVDTTGAPLAAHFVVIADDGTGNPPAALLATIASAIDAVRPLGTSFALLPPATLSVNVALTVQMAASAAATIPAEISAAIQSFIAALPIGGSLPLTRIAGLAYAADPGVQNVTGITLNGLAQDLAATAWQVLLPGSIVVS